MAHSLSHDISHGAARASVIKTNAVDIKTTVLLFRVRNVIEEQNKSNQIVAEEMLTWGVAYAGGGWEAKGSCASNPRIL